MVTQETEFLKARCMFDGLLQMTSDALDEKQPIHQLETDLFSGLLKLGLAFLETFVEKSGDGDVGEELVDDQQHTVRRLPEKHHRRYLSVFGELSIQRFVYGTREKQKIEAVPLDAQLGLPAGEFSYVLENWLQRLCVKESFAEACHSLETLLSLKPSVRAAEEMNRRLAEFVDGFRIQRPAVSTDEDASILVATADGKGVPMRRQTSAERGRRSKGQSANKKQMAYVGAVYNVDPHRRTAADLLGELQKDATAVDRPIPQHKRLWAEMTYFEKDFEDGIEINGRASVFGHLADEIASRRKPDATLVCLMDGERALWEMQALFLPDAVCILDLFHVTERLWTAAHCFHAEGSRAATEFVTHRLRMLLEGRVGRVIGGLRQMLTKQQLSRRKRTRVESVITYYENNRTRMKYDEYLSEGYPIGSGVVEGACRHLVKDRMEQTGMRWVLRGARAMLDTRATYLNGEWDDFITYRINTEQTQLHAKKWTPQATAA